MRGKQYFICKGWTDEAMLSVEDDRHHKLYLAPWIQFDANKPMHTSQITSAAVFNSAEAAAAHLRKLGESNDIYKMHDYYEIVHIYETRYGY